MHPREICYDSQRFPLSFCESDCPGIVRVRAVPKIAPRPPQNTGLGGSYPNRIGRAKYILLGVPRFIKSQFVFFEHTVEPRLQFFRGQDVGVHEQSRVLVPFNLPVLLLFLFPGPNRPDCCG